MTIPNPLLRQNLNAFCSDLDFEYPADGTQGQGFADLLTALRSAFDALAEQNGDAQPYQLTVRDNVTTTKL